MNNTPTVWNLRDRNLITFKFLLELHLERKNNTKRPHVKTKAKEFSSLCHCYHRVYDGDKCPLRITLLDRFAWKPGHYTSRCMMIYENLTDELSMKRLENKLSIKTTEHFFKSGGLFNSEEKGKTLLSVVFWNLGDRENFLQVDIKLEQHYLKSKNFTMKGTMLLGVTFVYKFVVHCYKTLSLWGYPLLFGFLLYL